MCRVCYVLLERTFERVYVWRREERERRRERAESASLTLSRRRLTSFAGRGARTSPALSVFCLLRTHVDAWMGYVFRISPIKTSRDLSLLACAYVTPIIPRRRSLTFALRARDHSDTVQRQRQQLPQEEPQGSLHRSLERAKKDHERSSLEGAP